MAEQPWYIQQIETLSRIQLVGYLAVETSHAASFRKELERRANKGDKVCVELRDAGYNLIKNPPPDEIAAEFESLWKDIVTSQKPISELSTFFLNRSGWGFIDPAGKMRSQPWECKSFLQNFIYNDEYYKVLENGQRGFVDVIAHSYIRHLNKPK